MKPGVKAVIFDVTRRKIVNMSKPRPTEDQLRERTKKCPDCNQVKRGTEYTICLKQNGAPFLLAHCKPCRSARMKEYRVKNPSYAARQDAQSKASNAAWVDLHQSATLESASNHYKEWTGPELELLAREDLKVTEMAKMLGRTMHSVRRMRAKVLRDPRKRDLAGIPEASKAAS